MDADGIGRLDLVQLVELVNRPAPVEIDRHLPLFRVDRRDPADIAVEDIFVIVVARLQDFVARAELGAEALDFRAVGARGVEGGLQSGVEFANPETPPVHGHQHLDVAHRVEPDASGDFLAHQLEHQTDNFFGLLAVQEGEIRILLGCIFRHPSMAHIMGRPHNAACFRLAKNFGQPHGWHRITGQKIGQNRSRTHAG